MRSSNIWHVLVNWKTTEIFYGLALNVWKCVFICFKRRLSQHANINECVKTGNIFCVSTREKTVGTRAERRVFPQRFLLGYFRFDLVCG